VRLNPVRARGVCPAARGLPEQVLPMNTSVRLATLRVSALLVATCLLAIPALTLPPTAEAQDGPATRYIRQQHDEVLRIMRRAAETDDARRRRSGEVTRILSQLLDYEELSRRSLGDHWTSRSPQQRQQFVDLLRQLVERNYEENLQRILDFEVRYTREEPGTDGTVVHTEARSSTERRQPPVEITYSMRLHDAHWRVFDVVTDGVSLVRNYQTQFHRIITQNGWDELIQRMQQRLASGGTSAAAGGR
jgi:phospholipid transport system substrate-binding protein